MKKLYRSSKDKMIAGVCAGVAEYASMDPTVVRLLTLLVLLFTGIFPVVIIYIIAALIVPVEGEDKSA